MATIPEEKDFELYMTNARDEFVKVVNGKFPHEEHYADSQSKKWARDIRVAAEDILICFDQIRERLAASQSHQVSTKKKISQSESVPEFQESIENMSQEEKDHVDRFLEQVEQLRAERNQYREAFEKLSLTPKKSNTKVSNCCGCPPKSYGEDCDQNSEDFGICADCGEHCEYIDESESQPVSSIEDAAKGIEKILIESEYGGIENDGTRSKAGHIDRAQYKKVAEKIASLPKTESDAVEFAEWIEKNNWFQDGDFMWFHDVNQIKRVSTPKLYQLFIQSKGG